MINFLYNFGITFYHLAARVASLFSPKARLFIRGRKNLFKKLRAELEDEDADIIWIHCASLGEFEQARPLIEAFKVFLPQYKILLTFFSPSGYEIRKNYELANWVFYLPVDHPSAAKKFVELVKPQLVVFIKYEFWFNLLKAVKEKNITLISVSSIFRPDQVFFKKHGKFFRKALTFFNHIFVQDEQSFKLLTSQGFENVTIAGDTRFDRVAGIRSRIDEIPLARTFSENEEVMIIGSCWPADMDLLSPFINENQHLKFIIAPHNIDERFIAKTEHELLRPSIRFSKAKGKNVREHDVLIIDNIGMLSSLYQYGKYAYVGGAFGQGLHNILEPATFGLPVFFGNRNFQKFREANDLINRGGAFAVGNYAEFLQKFRQLNEDKDIYQMSADIAGDYVKNNTGATKIVIEYCREKLKQ